MVDTLNPNLSGAQNALIFVQPTQLIVASDTNVTAGVASGVTVSAVDAYGNINPNYVGTVHFTSSDSNAVLPGDVTLGPAQRGTVTVVNQTTFKTARLSQSLTATDSINGLFGVQSGILVNPGPTSALVVWPPANVVAGIPFSLTVTAYDAYSNIATNYTGRVTMTASDPNAVLPPTSVFTLANVGTKTYTNAVRLNRTGTQLITVTDGNNFLVDMSSVVVQSGVVAALTLTGPTTTVAGAPLTLTLTAFDAYGNIATGMNDTVVVTGSDIAGTYPPSVAFGPSDAGVRGLTNLTTLRTAGLVTLSAADTNSVAPRRAAGFST